MKKVFLSENLLIFTAMHSVLCFYSVPYTVPYTSPRRPLHVPYVPYKMSHVFKHFT